MAQLVASVSGVVLGGVAEVVGSKYLQHLLAQLIHYIPPYIYICLFHQPNLQPRCRF